MTSFIKSSENRNMETLLSLMENDYNKYNKNLNFPSALKGLKSKFKNMTKNKLFQILNGGAI